MEVSGCRRVGPGLMFEQKSGLKAAAAAARRPRSTPIAADRLGHAVRAAFRCVGGCVGGAAELRRGGGGQGAGEARRRRRRRRWRQFCAGAGAGAGAGVAVRSAAAAGGNICAPPAAGR